MAYFVNCSQCTRYGQIHLERRLAVCDCLYVSNLDIILITRKLKLRRLFSI